MADWYIEFYERADDGFGNRVGEFSLQNPQVEIRNSEAGGFSGELALGQLRRGSTTLGITRDMFAPYRSTFQLKRQSSGSGTLITAGMLTSVNLNKDRDTIAIAGQDWLHYLQRRIWPFDPALYRSGDWIRWPIRWPDMTGALGPKETSPNPIDVGLIVRDLIRAVRFDPPSYTNWTYANGMSTQWPAGATPTLGAYQITQNIPLLGKTTKYEIYPGDPTTILDHVRKLSEQVDNGFEFDILPLSLEFKVYPPTRDLGLYAYAFTAGHDDETKGQVIEFDWTNEGPDATYLLGLGSGGKTGAKVGQVWTTIDNRNEFSRMDKVYDFGELQFPGLILQMLKDQNDLHPQKKLSVKILNPEFAVPNFYTGGRPRSLIGARIFARHDFRPYHLVDADFRVNGLRWNIDSSTNEEVEVELEMLYED